MKNIFIIFLNLLSTTAYAGSVLCRVSDAKIGTVFTPYVGGKAMVDLETGNTTLYLSMVSELQVISATSVSSFLVSREKCIFGTETLVTNDGQLIWKLFKFNHCLPNDGQGFVRVSVIVDLNTKEGKYMELKLTPTGTPPSAWVNFVDCEL